MMQQLLLGLGGLPDPVYVDDVFSTDLYTANNAAVTITNGLDLAGEGGMVWGKSRSATQNHMLYDTEGNGLYPNLIYGNYGTNSRFSANSNGYNLTAASGLVSGSGYGGPNYVNWSFRKAPGFFDVFTYKGTGSPQNISHSIGSVPGMILIKCSNTNPVYGNWVVWHRGFSSYGYMHINSTLPAFTASAGHVTSTSSSTFTCGGHTDTNGSGKTYVAYIFAHDDAQFGTDRDESIIKCGTYTGNGGSNRNIVTGFQPQWVLIAKSSFEHNWYIFDNQRSYYYIRTENASQEHNGTNMFKGFPSNGFMVNGNGGTNGNGDEFIYMAISA